MKQFRKLVQGIAVIALLLSPLSSITIFNATPASAGVNRCTWTGAGANNNWSTDANWSCTVGTGPATGYDLIFNYVDGVLDSNNDLPATNTYATFWVTGNSTCISNNLRMNITGNTIQLAGDITIDSTTDSECYPQLAMPNVTFTSDASIVFDSTTNVNPGNFGLISAGVHTINIQGNPAPTSSFNRTFFQGTLAGSGIVNVDDAHWSNNGFTGFTGTLNIADGKFTVVNEGSATATINVNNNASLILEQEQEGFPGDTHSFDITTSGTGYLDSLSSVQEAKIHNGGMSSLSPSASFSGDDYAVAYENVTMTLDGDITLGSNLDIGAVNNIELTGNLSGAFTISRTTELIENGFGNSYPYGGSITINGATNTTSTANSTLSPSVVVQTLSDLQPGINIDIGALHEVTLTGSRADTVVFDGGVLLGNGTIANLTSESGVLRPGLSPGVLSTGNLDFDAATTVDIELEGTTPGDHDQFDVTGTVSLGGATLNTILFNGYVPALNDSFTIINNDVADAITGTFNGLAEGATITVDSFEFTISYVGGDGNDVVLTTTTVPGPPGTGFGVLKSSYVLPVVALIFGAGLLGKSLITKKSLKKSR